MITISQLLEKLIKQKPFVESALVEGLINISALARQLKPEIESTLKKEVTEASIIMALKRFVEQMDVSMHRKIEKATKGFGDIIVRSNLCDFTYKLSETLIEKQSILIKKIGKEKDVFFTISRGVFETTIVISSQYADEVKEIYKEETLIASSNFISSITLRLPKNNTVIPGLYYHIFKQIAWEGISILEAVSTTNELSIILNDKDVDRAFSVLKQSYV
ncbi:MAG: aspartate kinase [Bacteroidetes bacterium]|nr:aspartate kinase [Bacteroidota bacterium]